MIKHKNHADTPYIVRIPNGKDLCNVLEYLAKDEQTKVIAMYMEGLKKGR